METSHQTLGTKWKLSSQKEQRQCHFFASPTNNNDHDGKVMKSHSGVDFWNHGNNFFFH
jgi:hypothetical protein